MNIQFGNFIEKLLHTIVNNETLLTTIEHISGTRKTNLSITKESQRLIDDYITNCENTTDDNWFKKEFKSLLTKCLRIEKKTPLKEIQNKYDIDVLFKTSKNKHYYLEVKYNDDHDTGKYANINSKFIKTYVGISNQINIYDIDKFKPILYYLNAKRIKGNIYLPEQENIYRGDKLFKEFSSVNYNDLATIMDNIGTDKDIIALFDNLGTYIHKNGLTT